MNQLSNYTANAGETCDAGCGSIPKRACFACSDKLCVFCSNGHECLSDLDRELDAAHSVDEPEGA